MPRPRRCRRIGHRFGHDLFKPSGLPAWDLEQITLTIDELEAIRLKDSLAKDQDACAKEMDVSQPTFHRLLAGARQKIADALVFGKALKIEGGNIRYSKEVKENE